MGDGLEGRRLTGLLTVKRENFPGMREFGLGGGAEWDAGAGAGRRSRPPALGAPGRGVELDGPMDRLRRGSPLTGPRLRAASPLFQPFLEHGRKRWASTLLPSPRLIRPALRGGGAGGQIRQQERGTFMACDQVLARASERKSGGCRAKGQDSLQPGLVGPRVPASSLLPQLGQGRSGWEGSCR